MISNSDVCMLVFTSALNLHERALSVNNTWLKDFPCGYLVGGYCVDNKLRMISAGAEVGEDYFSATDKQYFGLKKAYELHPDKAWFYITGCDAFIYSAALIKLLGKYDSTQDYYVGGYANPFTVLGEDITVLSGGSGFALSNSLAKKIIDSIPDIYSLKKKLSEHDWGCCDVIIAYYIETILKVQPTVCDGFCHCQPYNMREEFHCEPVAFHMLNIREMYSLYAGKTVTKPNVFFHLIDRFHKVLIKIFRTKTLVNRLCSFFYGKKR